MKYDEQGIIQGFQAAPIHIFNKNEYALKGTEYYDMVQSRDNVILMGDSVGDAGMADGMEHANAVLKIGFIHDHVSILLSLLFALTHLLPTRIFILFDCVQLVKATVQNVLKK